MDSEQGDFKMQRKKALEILMIWEEELIKYNKISRDVRNEENKNLKQEKLIYDGE